MAPVPWPAWSPPGQTKAKATPAPASEVWLGWAWPAEQVLGRRLLGREHTAWPDSILLRPLLSGPLNSPAHHPLGLLFRDGLGKEAEMGPAQARACFWKTRSKSACPEPWAIQWRTTGVVSGPQGTTCPRNVQCGPGPQPPPSIHVHGTLFPCSLNISQ